MQAAAKNMRRNYTASAGLSLPDAQMGEAGSSSAMRRNISAATLCELRRREQSAMAKSDAPLQGSRGAVVEAVGPGKRESGGGQRVAAEH